MQNVPTEQGENAAIKVSLTGVTIEGDTNLASWTRVAINTSVTTNEEGNALIASERGDNTTYLYQNAPVATENKYTPISSATTMKEAIKTIDASKVTLAAAKETLDTSIVLKENLGSTGNTTVEIGVSVWMEGTMGAQDTAKGQSISVKLTFKGEEVK